MCGFLGVGNIIVMGCFFLEGVVGYGNNRGVMEIMSSNNGWLFNCFMVV